MTKAGDGKISLWAVIAIGVGGMVGGGQTARESIREGVESAWDSLKSAVSDAAAKFTA